MTAQHQSPCMQPIDSSAMKTVSCYGWAVTPLHMSLHRDTRWGHGFRQPSVDSLHLQVCQNLKAPAADRRGGLACCLYTLIFKEPKWKLIEQRFKDSALGTLRTIQEEPWAHSHPCRVRSRATKCDLGIPQVLSDLFPILSTQAWLLSLPCWRHGLATQWGSPLAYGCTQGWSPGALLCSGWDLKALTESQDLVCWGAIPTAQLSKPELDYISS